MLTFISEIKNKLRSIHTIPFLVCLVILLLNDFYLKAVYPNWLTGKLSDVCGLLVFVIFWSAMFPKRKQFVYFSIALLFVFWKSPYSQSLIDFFSISFYPIYRVVDVTDLIALAILPIAYYSEPNRDARFKLNPFPVALLTVFSFCATSVPEPVQVFEQPQYLLFKSRVTTFGSSEYPGQYEVYQLDSLIIIDIKSIRISEIPSLDDDFHKVRILRDIDLRLLRESQKDGRKQKKLIEYQDLRDSLIVPETKTITLNLDSVTDVLNFRNSRLHGNFKRYSQDGSISMEGSYKNGIEDSVWNFYNSQKQIAFRKYFDNGELTKTEIYENATLKSVEKTSTRRETVRNKYFQLAILLLLIIGLTVKLYSNFKKSNHRIIHLSHAVRITGALVLPVFTFFLAKIISSFIPNSYSVFFIEIFIEAIVVYVTTAAAFFLIFYLLKLRNKLDLIYYILLFSLVIVLTEESFYLINII